MAKLTYAKAGVDVNKAKKVQGSIAGMLESTLNPSVLLGAGHYSGLMRFNGKILALHCDGVGTKVLIAQQLRKYDTVGIDCVAMNVNDLACVGAKPVALVDYLAVEKADEKQISEIMKGLVAGAKEADCAIIGGETAIIPELIKGIEGRGFDLSATCAGQIETEEKIITGEKIGSKDVIVGLASSGLHSNGYTLARKAIIKGGLGKDKKTLNELLVPTKIYSPIVLELIQNFEIHGLAHITGGAFSKLQRIGAPSKKGFILDSLPKPQKIFGTIQESAGISEKEMHRTFNMGIGFCIVCSEEEAENAVSFCRKKGTEARIVGRILADSSDVILEKNGKRITLT